MDITFSIVSGLFLRIAANNIPVDSNLPKVAAALVGAWEGVIVHQLSSRATSEVDHYLAYGLRALIDYFVSTDRTKALMILAWTALGAFASESITPRSTLQARPSKKDSSHRRRRSSHGRLSSSRRRVSDHTSSYRLPLLPPNINSNEPKVPITRPPSEPSYFLGAGPSGSEVFSPFNAPINPLDLSPTRPPNGLATHLEEHTNETPTRKGNGNLPTPPQSNPSDGLELGASRPATSPHRLSTIHEISSAAERTPPPQPRTHDGGKGKQKAKAEPERELERVPEEATPAQSTQAPPTIVSLSSHTTPLPIPNLTMNGFSLSNPFPGNSDDDGHSFTGTDSIKHSTPFAANLPPPGPMPVPNTSTDNWRPHALDPLGPYTAVGPSRTDTPDPLASPAWDDDDALDELRTPPPQSTSGSALSTVRAPVYTDDDMDDPLRTPVNMNGNMLSPLVLDDELGSGKPLVSTLPQPAGPLPSISQVQALAESAAGPSYASAAAAAKAKKPKKSKKSDATNGNGTASGIPVPSTSTLFQGPVPTTPPSPLVVLPASAPPSGSKIPVPVRSGSKPKVKTANDPPSDPDSALSAAPSVFSTVDPTALNAHAEKLRQDAREAEAEVRELRAKQQLAAKEGRTVEAFLLKRKMVDAEEKAREAHRRAARRYYASLNELNPKAKEDTIDVHGLRPAEAIDRTERALSDAIAKGMSTLRVIVGKGLHSVGGQPVLKDAIKRNMENQGIDVEIDAKNTGVLILTVPAP